MATRIEYWLEVKQLKSVARVHGINLVASIGRYDGKVFNVKLE